jgi:hypothetical protein
MVFWKNGVCVGRSTWRVLPWHGGGSEYLEGTADVGGGHVRLTTDLFSLVKFPPFLEVLLMVV